MNNLLPWIAMSLACGVLALVGFYLRHRERVKTQEEKMQRTIVTLWGATSGASARPAPNISTQEQIVGAQQTQPPSQFGRYKN
jgi:hypothetical protein